jgi:hypothetical protein
MPTYDPATDHEPLFDIAPHETGGSEVTRRDRKVTVVDYVDCPECASKRAIGLIWQGEHVVVKLHDRVTMSGARLECRASGVPLCQLPAEAYDGVLCPHA